MFLSHEDQALPRYRSLGPDINRLRVGSFPEGFPQTAFQANILSLQRYLALFESGDSFVETNAQRTIPDEHAAAAVPYLLHRATVPKPRVQRSFGCRSGPRSPYVDRPRISPERRISTMFSTRPAFAWASG